MRQYTEYPDYLAHFGIKGMKWGVRRFQNKDGSYTAAGLKRRFGGGGGGGSRSGGKARAGSGTNAEARKAKIKKAAKIAAVAAGTGLAAYGAYRLAKSGKLKGAADAVRGLKGPSVPRIGGPVKKSFGSRARDIAGQGIAGVQNGAGIVRDKAGAMRDKFRNRSGGKKPSIPRLTGSRAGQVVDEARRPGAFKRASGAIKGAGDKIYNRMHGVRDVKPTTTALSTAVRGSGKAGPKRSFRDRVKSARNAAQGAAGAAYGKLDNAYRSNRAVRYGVNAGAAVGGFAAGRAAGKAVNRAIGAGVKRADKRTLSGGKPTKAPKGASRREIKKAAKARYKADIAKARQDMRDWGDKYNARDKANKGYARSKSGALSAERAVTRYQKAQKAAKERYRNSLKRR